MVAVVSRGPVWHVLSGDGPQPESAPLRFCQNWEHSACNWMHRADEDSGSEYCIACQHNRTVPDLSTPEHLALWMKIEAAKRRLIYTLIRLGLPRPVPGSGHPEPLVFDFLAEDPGSADPVRTGHADGVVTIALVEADDAAREHRRSQMGEAYRTLLGHFRHEIGHYYWDLLVRDGMALESFRSLFGDERADYADALEAHYQLGAPEGWESRFVSAYATMHPWEDWAETWAHYLHMVDTLETAAALGLRVDGGGQKDGPLATEIPLNPYREDLAKPLIDAWIPLTLALNNLNRSMGQSDLYPFSLPSAVQSKLTFVHDLVRQSHRMPSAPMPA